MPTRLDAPKRRLAQAPAKPIACYGGCGAMVEFLTNPRVYCPICKAERKLASARISMERNRRKRGIPEVKGTAADCEVCGARFERVRHAGARRCEKCRAPKYDPTSEFLCIECGDAIPRTGERGPPPSRCVVCRKARHAQGRRADRGRLSPKCRDCGRPVGLKRQLCAVCARARRLRYYLARYHAMPDAQYQAALGRARDRAKRRRRFDPKFDINSRMSSAIRQSIRQTKAGHKWEALVGYTVTDLMRHLERQFLPGMSWSNRARWHIDHIIPLSKFNFTSADDIEFKLAWSLTNLRPLWKRENLLKGGKRTLLL